MKRKPTPKARTKRDADPQANKLEQEARRTLITQLIAGGIYRPKNLLVELKARGHEIGRTQLWKDMAALDAEEGHDFREHRKRFRHVVFNRYLRRERDAEQSIADIRASEDDNYRRTTEYRKQRDAAEQSGLPLPKPPILNEIDYRAKARMLMVSMAALDKAAALAGLATQIVGSETGDLASWASIARESGADAFQKRRARVFPEYAKARLQRSRRAESHA